MGGNKDIRKRIQGLERQIALHLDKIAAEREVFPDSQVIGHWEKEVRNWTAQVERLMGRLPGRG
ncbi:hypothetical protein [Deinococcus marmoris]|uniref:hypothetical protein n=1 Tax=Deinococcus marmoris TaxID=249408 RepID=UPI0004956383|nr:hypothetical protein [Deinococcus marmoris]